MTNASPLITYAELTALYGPKAANDLLLVVERNAANGSHDKNNIVFFCKEQRLKQAFVAMAADSQTVDQTKTLAA